MTFKVGDRVTKKHGERVARVESVSGRYITVKYEDSKQRTYNEYATNYKLANEVLVIDPEDAEEILPYTIDVLIDGKIISYQADEGMFEKDEIYVMGKTLTLARVMKLDTKNKNARASFSPLCKLTVQYAKDHK